MKAKYDDFYEQTRDACEQFNTEQISA